MSWLISAPLLIPFITAVFAFLFRFGIAGRWISVAGNLALLIAGGALMGGVLDQGIMAGQMGGWPAPFGITLVADYLSAALVLITGVIGLAIAVYALGDINVRKEHLGYHALYNVLIGGVIGAFLTGDLFNLYVWFEVMLIASFGLLVLGGTRAQMDGGVRYVTLNLISTVLFLAGIGLLYGMTGTLNMADLAGRIAGGETGGNQGLVSVIALIFMVAFGVKAAVSPCFSGCPHPITPLRFPFLPCLRGC